MDEETAHKIARNIREGMSREGRSVHSYVADWDSDAYALTLYPEHQDDMSREEVAKLLKRYAEKYCTLPVDVVVQDNLTVDIFYH